MGLRHRSWSLLPLLAACQPFASGAGSGANNSVGEEGDSSTEGPTTGHETAIGDTEAATVGASGDSTTGGMVTGATGVDPTDGDPTDSDGGGTPALEISDGPTFDFGDVPLDTTQVHAFTVTNVGDGPAANLQGQALGEAFSYEGGRFPGRSGSCGGALATGAQCTVAVAFGPDVLGVHMQQLALSYDGGGDLVRPLRGGGAGSSANLLHNPGGEDGGSPPMSWSDVGNGDWVTSSEFPPQEGTSFIAAAGGNNNVPYRLVQEIDVGPWVSTIDLELMRFAFSGYTRSLSTNDNEYRILVRYFDAAEVELLQWSSEWGTGGAWTELTDTAIAPAGTRMVMVELGCRKSGGSICNAYYDQLDLHAVFP